LKEEVRRPFRPFGNSSAPSQVDLRWSGGEMKMMAAGVAVTDAQDIQGGMRAAGAGRVMGQGDRHRCGRQRFRPPSILMRPFFEGGQGPRPGHSGGSEDRNRHHYGTPAVLMACNELVFYRRETSARTVRKPEELQGAHCGNDQERAGKVARALRA